jgi:hypothetical protein
MMEHDFTNIMSRQYVIRKSSHIRAGFYRVRCPLQEAPSRNSVKIKALSQSGMASRARSDATSRDYNCRRHKGLRSGHSSRKPDSKVLSGPSRMSSRQPCLRMSLYRKELRTLQRWRIGLGLPLCRRREWCMSAGWRRCRSPCSTYRCSTAGSPRTWHRQPPVGPCSAYRRSQPAGRSRQPDQQ